MKNAFTLIEILVVITLIATLSTIGFATYQGTSGKARDSVRKDALRSLSTALEFYFQKNGEYIKGNGNCGDTSNFYSRIAPFMRDGQAPKDPSRKDGSGGPEKYCYTSVEDGEGFRLFAKLENCSDPDVLKVTDEGGNISTPSCGDFNYSLTSEGTMLALAELPTGDDTGGAGIGVGGGSSLKRVFVTSNDYMTNGSFGGSSGADSICREAAQNAAPSLGGEWKAWISDTGSSPDNRPDFTKNDVRFALVSPAGASTPIASSWQELTDGDLATIINIDENGGLVSSTDVWTGTTQEGKSFTGTDAPKTNCNNWTLSTGTGIQGSADKMDSGWTNNNLQSCSNQARLYCFEQDPPIAVATNPVKTIRATTSPTSTNATLNGSLVRSGSSYMWFRYSTTNTGSCASLSGQETPPDSLGTGTTLFDHSEAVSGLTQDTIYFFCAVGQTSQGVFYGDILTFRTGTPPLPSIHTDAATRNSATQATLNGRSDPMGSTATVWLNYGTTSATCGNLTTKNAGSRTISGTATTAFTHALTDIPSGATYYFCAVVQNSVGTYYGSVLPYYNTPTAPSITNRTYTGVSSTGATLTGSVNPNGLDTQARFLWGTTNTTCASLTNTSPPISIGAGTTTVSITRDISLTSGSTYYFCVEAINSAGTAYNPNGSARTSFTTPIPASTAYKRVFRSRQFYSIANQTGPTYIYGTNRAHQACQAEADNPLFGNYLPLGGTWKAWISDSTTSPSNSFTNRGSPSVPYKLMDGATIASSWTDLTDGQLNRLLSVLPTGVDTGSEHQRFWTGTNYQGNLTSLGHCNNWTSNSSSQQVTVGNSYYSDSKWTDFNAATPTQIYVCGNPNSLYCFEQ